MAKNKKREVSHYPFESTTTKGAFTKICKDMQESIAWQELNLRQHGLYLCFKKKFTKNKKQETNENNISLPKSEAEKLYGDLRTFRKDLDILISKGFIKQIASGFNTRTVNVYGFSDRWKFYGTAKFDISEKDKRYIPEIYRK